MTKRLRENVKLISSAGDKHFYTTTKNKRSTKKIKLKKFHPKTRRHILYTESKLK